MTALVTEDLASIFDNYADVIEGGNSYRGSGDTYLGVPGLHSSDQKLLRDGFSSITVSDNGTTTTVPYASGDWVNADWVKTNTPGFWIIDSADEHRKITNWGEVEELNQFTVASAFTTAPAASDTVTIQQGFKRAPEGQSIIDMGDGWDRFFELRTEGVPEDIGFHGAGVVTYQTTMILALRMVKHAKDQLSHDRVISNLTILARALCRGAHRGGSSDKTRALILAGGPGVVEEDSQRVIAEVSFDLIYRVSSLFK